MPIEQMLLAAQTLLLAFGWILVSAFGIYLYVDFRSVPKEVIKARMFLNMDRFIRGFLVLSIGFLVVLLAAVPRWLGVPGAGYIAVGAASFWLASVVWSLLQIFRSVHIPRAVRAKFPAPAR